MARAIAVGCAHHIVQRGNNRQPVFMVDDDREVYLQILAEQAGKYGLEVLGYCLMTNHVHIIAIPHAEDSLGKGTGRTHFRYSQYINRFHKRSGHLWQGRPRKALTMDGRQGNGEKVDDRPSGGAGGSSEDTIRNSEALLDGESGGL